MKRILIAAAARRRRDVALPGDDPRRWPERLRRRGSGLAGSKAVRLTMPRVGRRVSFTAVGVHHTKSAVGGVSIG
jgi:hypothetical protein